MTQNNEILTAKGHQIEKSVIADVPLETELPSKGERLVIGATPKTNETEGESGLEVISLASHERTPEGKIIYDKAKNILLESDVEAIIVDPAVPPDFQNGTGYKGLRKGEVVTGGKLSGRFDKTAGFGIALDQDGKLMIDNADPSRPVNVLSIKPPQEKTDTEKAAESARTLMGIEDEVVNEDAPVESEEAMEASEELHEEAAEDLGEEALEEVIGNAEEFSEEPETAEDSEAVMGQVKKHITKLEEAVQEFDNGVRSFNFLREDAAALRKIALGLEGTYSDDGVRTLLTKLNQSLQGTFNRVRRAVEGDMPDIQRSTKGLSETLKTTAQLESISNVAEDLGAIQTAGDREQLDQNLSGLRNIIGHVDAVIDQSRRGGFNEGELIVMSSQLETLSNEGNKFTLTPKLEPHVEQIRRAIASI